MRFPNTTTELLDQLDKTFPEVVSTPASSHDDIMFDSGQRSVVLFLKQWRERADDPPPIPRQRGRGRKNVRS